MLHLIDSLFGIGDLLATLRDYRGFFDLVLVLRALVAVWLIVCMLGASVRVLNLLLPRAGLPLHFSSLLAVGTWLATLGFHVLRAIGCFNIAGALVAATTVLAAAVFVDHSRRPLRELLARERRALGRLYELLRRGRYNVVTVTLGAFAALLMLRALLVPPLGWDTLTYHGARAALWVQSGQFTFAPGPGTYGMFRLYVGGGELLEAWSMLPFHSDLLVNFGIGVQWIAVGLAVWSLARAIGVREPFASTSGVVVMFCPTLQLEMSSGYIEAPLNAALVHAAAVAVYGLGIRRLQAREAVLGAMSLGVAAGMKVTGAPAVIVIGLALVARLFRAPVASARVRSHWFAVCAVCVLMPVAPWLFAAWRETGYPLSPTPISVLGVKLGVATPALEWYQDRPDVRPGDWEAESEALLSMLGPIGESKESLGVMSCIPVLFAPLGFVVLLRRRLLAALLLAAAAAALLAAHFSDAMTVLRVMWPFASARYLITTIALLVPVSLAFCRRERPFELAYRLLLLSWPVFGAFYWVRYGSPAWEGRELVIWGVLLTMLYVLCRAGLQRSPRWGAALTVLVIGWTCSALQLRRDDTREDAYTDSEALHESPRFWSTAVPKIDEPDNPRRIAVTGGPHQANDLWLQYFFLGKRLQNELTYVTPTRDGAIAHFAPHGDLEARADYASWLARLQQRGITEVMSFAPESLELSWMNADPTHFERLDGDEDWGLYRLVDPSAPNQAQARAE